MTFQDPAAPEEPVETIVLNGKTYIPSPAALSGDFAGTAICEGLPLTLSDSETTYIHHTYKAYSAINGTTHISLDWADYSKPVDLNQTTAEPIAYSASRVPASEIDSSPFILDTGATIHISPIYGDFKHLKPIAPHPITSVGGAHVYATGMGSIKLCITRGHKVTLENTVYVPASKICLISILKLNTGGQYTSHFDSNKC